MRKKYIIYPKFQYKLIGYNLITSFTLLGITMGSIYFSFYEAKKSGESAGFPETHPFFKFLDMHYQNLFLIISASFLVGLLINIFINTLISHKVAGPIYRFRKEMKEIRESGKIVKFEFREKDFFSDLPAEFQETLDCVSQGKTNTNSEEAVEEIKEAS